MNIVEFALRLKDMASTPLRQFGTAAGQTFARANQMANSLSTHNRVLGQSYNELQAKIRNVENTIRTSTIPSQIRAARRELEALQRQSNNHPGRLGGALSAGSTPGGLSSGLMGMLGGGLMKAAGPLMAAVSIGAAVNAGAGFIGDSISKSLERQQIQTSFNVLAGSDQAGSALTKQLVGLQKDTILGSEVFQNAQTMMGFGIQSKDVYENLKMLGDVSMGDAQKLGSLTLAFSQVRAGGKLLGNDLIQFINAGFNPLEIMSQKTGKSIGVLKDEMSKGLITFGMVQQAFKDATSEGGRFNNMLAKIAETPAGKIQQLSGAWDEFKINAGAAFMPLVSMALDLAQAVLPIIEGLIEPLTSGIQQIAGLIKSVNTETGNWGYYATQIKELFGNYILPFVRQTWEVLGHIVSTMIDFVSTSVIIRTIFDIVVANLKAGFKALETIINVIKVAFDAFMVNLRAAEATYRFFTGTGRTMTRLQKVEYKNPFAPKEKKDQETTADLLKKIKENTASNASASKANESAISGGGQKVINISVAKFLDNINLTTMNMQEGAADIERIILEMFSRIVVQGAR